MFTLFSFLNLLGDFVFDNSSIQFKSTLNHKVKDKYPLIKINLNNILKGIQELQSGCLEQEISSQTVKLYTK